MKINYTEAEGAYLISAIGIFNTLGMIVLGWIGDQKWCNVTKTYAFCLLCEWSHKYSFETLSTLFSSQFVVLQCFAFR